MSSSPKNADAPQRDERAMLIAIHDVELQPYLQQFPFASGPDEALNERARRAVAGGLQFRSHTTRAVCPEEVVEPLGGLDAEILARARRLLTDARIPGLERHLREFAWKVAVTPRASRDILAVGIGDGIELLFLRALHPDARIVAADWIKRATDGLLAYARAEFWQTNIDTLISKPPEQFDCVFSNHTLEHMYDPDAATRGLMKCLRPGGTMVAGMPLDAMADDPIADWLRAALKNGRTFKWFDYTLLNAGHPWKSNPGDLADTLERAGFRQIRILWRRTHVSRFLTGAIDRLQREKRRRFQWYRALTRPAHRALNVVSFGRTPRLVSKVAFAVDRRLPFGINHLNSVYSPEAAVVARRMTD